MVIDFSNVMKHKTDYLTYEEIDSMLQYCFDNGKIRDYMLILTLYRTGRRISERDSRGKSRALGSTPAARSSAPGGVPLPNAAPPGVSDGIVG